MERHKFIRIETNLSGDATLRTDNDGPGDSVDILLGADGMRISVATHRVGFKDRVRKLSHYTLKPGPNGTLKLAKCK